MKSIIVFLLFLLTAISAAADTTSKQEQKPKVEVVQFGDTSALELVFPSGLRLEVEDLAQSASLEKRFVVGQREVVPTKSYEFTWQPQSHFIGVGLETEVIDQGNRKVLKTRATLRASKNFEGNGWKGSFYLKPIWEHRERSVGAKVGVRIDF